MFNTVPIVRFEQTHFNFNFTLVNSYKKNHLMKLANLYSNNKFKKKKALRGIAIATIVSLKCATVKEKFI